MRGKKHDRENTKERKDRSHLVTKPHLKAGLINTVISFSCSTSKASVTIHVYPLSNQ